MALATVAGLTVRTRRGAGVREACASGSAVALPADGPVIGSIMVEQVKSVDFRSRKARRIGTVSHEVLDEVLAILDACIY